MPKYVIEREIPKVGESTVEDLRKAAELSNKVLAEMGPTIQWIESYVTTDKFYCVYIADNEEQIREHGAKTGFPVSRIEEIKNMTGPERGKYT